MTGHRNAIQNLIQTCAILILAQVFSVCLASAQELSFRSPDGGVEVHGRFVAFDGEVITLATENGAVSFRADQMECEGALCPDLPNYVPRFRLTGAARMADVLLPALIEVYARDHGWVVTEDAKGFLLSRADGQDVLAIDLNIAPSEAAFDHFTKFEADALLSLRELRPAELQIARDAGLGALGSDRQARILALDALVPVVSAESNQRSISIAELVEALGEGSDRYNVYLPDPLTGQLEGFQDRFMQPFGLTLASSPSQAADTARRQVEQDDNGLTLLPFGEVGPTQALSLSGPCGLQTDAQFLTLKTEDYPLTFPMFLYLPERRLHPQIAAFLDWLRSPAAQLVIRRAGFADLGAVPIPLSEQGDRLASAIANAGPEIPLTELQRMVRLLRPRVRLSTTFRFEPGSTLLDGQSRSNVMQLAQAIRDGRFLGKELMFVGFSDGRGPADANRELSAARADAVLRDLTQVLGGTLPESVQFETDALGEVLPMACDDTLWGQQINRRVELWVRNTP